MSKKIKILLVDTDLDALSKLYLVLLHKGYRAEATNNSEEIVARMERFRPDLIVLALPAQDIPVNTFETIRKKRIAVLFILAQKEENTFGGLKKFETISAPYTTTEIEEKIKTMFNLLL